MCFGNLFLQLLRALVDQLELRELRVENADDLGQLNHVRLSPHSMRTQTYRIVRLARFAQVLRCAVDLLDHFGKILIQLIESVLKFLGEFVAIHHISRGVKAIVNLRDKGPRTFSRALGQVRASHQICR